ncbi:hypothetical protein [Sphingomonas sp. S6]|jgi:hypothetical protein|uniref:hypothetical protein n=1 Tax=Sphingomonas sp. S6 TaxID=3368600 RepID=UPI000FAB04E1|nr:hypothetical protein [uncultured Sphingomonas sp.]RTL15294.1 MAG: hypothetical protein EKK50_13425 [Sphingomonadaceae bacterium]
MNAPVSINAPLDPATLAIVEELARSRGITGEEFAADAIRKVAEHDIELRAFIQEGIDSIERDGGISQEDMEAWFEERVAARKRR